jgi:hypothetical protein
MGVKERESGWEDAGNIAHLKGLEPRLLVCQVPIFCCLVFH